jgi:hypothetical protein
MPLHRSLGLNGVMFFQRFQNLPMLRECRGPRIFSLEMPS